MAKNVSLVAIGLAFLLALIGCEDTNLKMATEAGMEAVKAITLSDEEVQQLAEKAAAHADAQNRLAPPESAPSKRLRRLTKPHRSHSGYSFDYGVYLSSKVNAFALADGTIRFYSGLMDMMNDQELLFVIGHEMGHVVEDHIEKKMVLALASSALRKGIASQENIIGDLARSSLGGFLQRFAQATFSREEEKAADDYALEFMQQEGYDPTQAVSALEKLARLGSDHSFLSTHPEPQDRAERMRKRLRSPEKKEVNGIVGWIWSLLLQGIDWLLGLIDKALDLLPGK
jgi:putative metalloprotease